MPSELSNLTMESGRDRRNHCASEAAAACPAKAVHLGRRIMTHVNQAGTPE